MTGRLNNRPSRQAKRCHLSILVFVLPMLVACESLLFYPQKTLLRNPADVGLVYKNVIIEVESGDHLHGWWLPAVGSPIATVVFFHGNAENISTHLASVYWLPAEGVNVLLTDYRGYGLSTGYPTVKNAIADVKSTLTYASARDDQHSMPLIVLGQSLGASLSGRALGEDPARFPTLAGVVLDAGFSRYSDAAAEAAANHFLTWLFQYPAAWSMPNNVDLLDVIANIAPVPLLIIHGVDDPVVAYAHAEKLYAAAGEPKQLLGYRGGHIQTFGFEDNRQKLLEFIRDSASGWQRQTDRQQAQAVEKRW